MDMKTGVAGMEDSGEFELARRVAAGDARAFETMMRRYNGRLYRAARSILKDDTEAEDALQEAYWKAYCKMGSFRAESRLSTWLTRIVINEALMRMRRNKRQAQNLQALAPDHAVDGSTTAMESVARHQDNPDQLAWRGELRHLIERRVDELPDVYRSVFVLRAVEDMPAIEVAEVLGIPEATVRTRLFRARHLLQGALAGDIDTCSRDAFSFAGHRCDRIVAAVLARLAQQPPDAGKPGQP